MTADASRPLSSFEGLSLDSVPAAPFFAAPPHLFLNRLPASDAVPFPPDLKPIFLYVRTQRDAPRPVINPFLFMKNLQEGMRTTVVCSVLSGESPMDIDWLKDGAPLSDVHPEAKITRLGDFASSLTMDNVTRRHSGNYSCKATSGIATANYTARMDVSGKT
ncbi:hypothetical protein MRX96_011857 [Rhipicephalus microplus]